MVDKIEKAKEKTVNRIDFIIESVWGLGFFGEAGVFMGYMAELG